MIAETISLGILSLPSALAAIGILPYVRTTHEPTKPKADDAFSGVILILSLGIIATYTGYVIGQFKLAYPHVHNMCLHFQFTPPRIVPKTRSQYIIPHSTTTSSPLPDCPRIEVAMLTPKNLQGRRRRSHGRTDRTRDPRRRANPLPRLRHGQPHPHLIHHAEHHHLARHMYARIQHRRHDHLPALHPTQNAREGQLPGHCEFHLHLLGRADHHRWRWG